MSSKHSDSYAKSLQGCGGAAGILTNVNISCIYKKWRDYLTQPKMLIERIGKTKDKLSYGEAVANRYTCNKRHKKEKMVDGL